MEDKGQAAVNKAVNAVESEQGKFASMKGEKPPKESGHGSASEDGVKGYLVPGGQK